MKLLLSITFNLILLVALLVQYANHSVRDHYQKEFTDQVLTKILLDIKSGNAGFVSTVLEKHQSDPTPHNLPALLNALEAPAQQPTPALP